METVLGFAILYLAANKIQQEYERANKAVKTDNKSLALTPNFNLDDFQRDDFQDDYNVLNEPTEGDIQRLGGIKALGDQQYYKALTFEDDDLFNQTATVGIRTTVPEFSNFV